MTGVRTYGPWFPLLLVLILQAVLIANGTAPILDGELLGPDSYMRLHRVTLLEETGAWFDPVIPRGDAPHGEIMHWTRPFDVLLLAGAWLGALVADFETALFWSGALIGPLLQLLTLAALCWAAAPVLEGGRGVFLALLSLLQPAVIHFFFAGRADHHSLLILLFVLSMGFTIRLLLWDFQARLCHAAGAVMALSLWVSVESLVVLAANLSTLGVLWIFSERDLARKTFHVSVALLAGVSVALVLERPWDGLLVADHDRFSVVHWSLAAVIAAFWGVVLASGRNGGPLSRTPGRLAATALGALLAAVVMGTAFPGFFRGPLADQDPRIIHIWLERIGEYRPLVDLRDPALGPAVYWLGLALPALPMLAWNLRWPRRPEHRAAWTYLAIALALFLPLAFYQVRWTGYAVVLLLVPYAELLVRTFERIASAGARLQLLLRTAALVVFCGAFTVLGLVLMRVEGSASGASATVPACRLSGIARFLDDPAGWGSATRTVLAPVDFGPELLYRTRHRMVATPYHRNRQGMGILASHLIMSAPTEEAARELVEERRIDLILLCPSGGFFRPGKETPSLYGKLLDHRVPPWLREVTLPDGLAGRFLLFEVRR